MAYTITHSIFFGGAPRRAQHVNRSARSDGDSAITLFRRIRNPSHRSGRSCSRYIIS